MIFTIFDSVKSQVGRICTYEEYIGAADGERVRKICAAISHEEDSKKRAVMKSQLPVITWQASFDGHRLIKNSKPSGLFMLDIDHIDNPAEIYNSFAGRLKELGIVFVSKTASCHGLRLVAKCRKEYSTLEECQKWLSSEIGVKYDAVCKDFARCSFVVPIEYTYFMDNKAIWQEEPEEGTIYKIEDTGSHIKGVPAVENKEFTRAVFGDVDQREGLFGGSNEYRGLDLTEICRQWLEYTGGEPKEGERNTRLHRLAIRLRYITDFNPATMFRVMPHYDLPDDEVKTIIHSALNTTRGSEVPRDMQEVITQMLKRKDLVGDDATRIDDEVTFSTTLPPMPPVIRQYVECAPDDFKEAVALCQLPILGALGSKLRAKYIDGQIHSPSFQVSLEAPQASGKSFMTRMVNEELKAIIQHDEIERAKEDEYNNKIREMKLLNQKITPENKDEILGQRPKTIIRFVPPTMSVTKLLQRMQSARGLHLFSVAPEIDTITKAFKRGFSSFSDLLRISFDNEKAGQDYASENSFSGVVQMYYNLLASGTPKAMRRFYPDVEDGLVSRVCFVTLPDQFGKPMPIWKTMDSKQQMIVDLGLERLNNVSIQGDDVQDDYMLKLGWLNVALQQWLGTQQAEAVKLEDRTRDIFCRRAAVVGFRAGMLAWFLYGEKNTPTIRRNVIKFSEWVASMMLRQHLLRFNINSSGSNVNQWEEPFGMLKDTFTREEAARALHDCGIDTPVRMVLYKWRILGIIENEEIGRGESGHKQAVKFKKIKK